MAKDLIKEVLQTTGLFVLGCLSFGSFVVAAFLYAI